MNRREHVHFRCQAFKRTPSANVTVSRNVIRQTLGLEPVKTEVSSGVPRASAAHVSLSSLFNCQRSDTSCPGLHRLKLLPYEDRLRGSLNSPNPDTPSGTSIPQRRSSPAPAAVPLSLVSGI